MPMIPPSFLTNWGVMAHQKPEQVPNQCVCGCHNKQDRPPRMPDQFWCIGCMTERNQPWTDWITSITL
jgi:hypothetical protein